MELIVKKNVYLERVFQVDVAMFKDLCQKEIVASLKTENILVWLEHVMCSMEGVRGESECERPVSHVVQRAKGSQWRLSEDCDEIRSMFLNNHYDYTRKSRMEPVGQGNQKRGYFWRVSISLWLRLESRGMRWERN